MGEFDNLFNRTLGLFLFEVIGKFVGIVFLKAISFGRIRIEGFDHNHDTDAMVVSEFWTGILGIIITVLMIAGLVMAFVF